MASAPMTPRSVPRATLQEPLEQALGLGSPPTGDPTGAGPPGFQVLETTTHFSTFPTPNIPSPYDLTMTLL